jgi:hypothetical protein
MSSIIPPRPHNTSPAATNNGIEQQQRQRHNTSSGSGPATATPANSGRLLDQGGAGG